MISILPFLFVLPSVFAVNSIDFDSEYSDSRCVQVSANVCYDSPIFVKFQQISNSRQGLLSPTEYYVQIKDSDNSHLSVNTYRSTVFGSPGAYAIVNFEEPCIFDFFIDLQALLTTLDYAKYKNGNSFRIIISTYVFNDGSKDFVEGPYVVSSWYRITEDGSYVLDSKSGVTFAEDDLGYQKKFMDVEDEINFVNRIPH